MKRKKRRILLINILIVIYLLGILIHALAATFLMKTKSHQEYVFVLICIVGWPIFLVIEILDYFSKKRNNDE